MSKYLVLRFKNLLKSIVFVISNA